MADEENPTTEMTTEKTSNTNEEVPQDHAEVKVSETCENIEKSYSTEGGTTSTSVTEEAELQTEGILIEAYKIKENGEEGYHTPDETETVNVKSDVVDVKDDTEDARELDDDEIEENPAYIPKKGKYYMHDSRGEVKDDGEEKKMSRADGAWKHDRFDERWQRPKTKKQLLTRYGFDIRDEDAPHDDIEGFEKKKDQSAQLRKKNTAARDDVRGAGKRKTMKIDRIARQKDERCLDKDTVSDHAVKDEWSSKEERISRTEQERDKGSRRMDRNQNQGEERAGERRQRSDVRVVRNVRGRGGYVASGSSNRYDRHGSHRERFDREDRNLEGYHREHRGDEREYENHRRGVMRGTVRGGQSNYGTQRQYTRTFSSSYRGGIKGGTNSRGDEYRTERGRNNGFERNGRSDGYVQRDSGNYYTDPSVGRGYSTRTQRGGYSNRSSSRGGYSTRGFSGPKRYSVQRGDAPPHYSNMPRQPTDVVYFDPSQQINRQPPPPREKKIIEIVPPSA